MRLTFDYVSRLATAHGYVVEKEGNGYVLFSNTKMPGVEILEDSLTELYGELYHLINF